MGQTHRQGGTALFRVHERNRVSTWDEDGCVGNPSNSMGTYIHGLFDNPQIVRFWLDHIKLNHIEISDLEGFETRNREYDLLAEHVKEYVDLGSIENII